MNNTPILLPTYDELTDDLKLLSDIIGLENVIKLINNLQGLEFYIPKYTKLKKYINRYLNFRKGASIKQISLELNVSEQFIRNFQYAEKKT